MPFTPLQMKVESHPRNLAAVRLAAERYAKENGYDEEAVGAIGLCVNEAMANVIRHAYHGAEGQPIEFAADAQDGSLSLTFRDWGDGVNPQELPPKPHDPLQPGGVGLICLRQLMDEVVFTRQPDGMLLKMVYRRGHAGSNMRACGQT